VRDACPELVEGISQVESGIMVALHLFGEICPNLKFAPLMPMICRA
jgi:hypothetical protein